jgi:ferrous iron transport protein B
MTTLAPTTTPSVTPAAATVALVGNPNAGKTTLFNALTGLRAKTANYPGTTTELRFGKTHAGTTRLSLIDLPGAYSLRGVSPEERVAVDAVLGRGPAPDGGEAASPDALIVLIDATNLERNLYLAGEVLELGIPAVVALNMSDLADRRGYRIDTDALAERLGAPVIRTTATRRRGVDELRAALGRVLRGESEGYHPQLPLSLRQLEGCTPRRRHEWAEEVATAVQVSPHVGFGAVSEAIDRWLTRPLLGLPVFAAVMLGLFYTVFSLASVPMDLIDGFFGRIGAWVGGALGDTALSSLVVDGVIGGVGGTLVFLPQIAILFFLISLLEDTGYLARAAFVMDKLMRKVGLPGKAFVPMLSSHACAIPGIMACRTIESRGDRLRTIMILPLLTCSARLPVYAMITALLFANAYWYGALAFTGAYALGIVAAMAVAAVLRFSILRGRPEPLVIELPTYKVPSLRNALLTAWDRTLVFVKKAGTVILAIMIVLWWMSSYPSLPDASATAAASAPMVEPAADELTTQQQALEYSVAGRMGKLIEPVIEPLGFDWKIGIGVVTSFAARETVVGTLGVVYGVGDEVVDDPAPLLDRIREAKHPDGSPVFTVATCMSLLVFYVLAMQCLPTQAVTRRETGSWKWAAFQLGYMTALAYTASLITYQTLAALGWG